MEVKFSGFKKCARKPCEFSGEIIRWLKAFVSFLTFLSKYFWHFSVWKNHMMTVFITSLALIFYWIIQKWDFSELLFLLRLFQLDAVKTAAKNLTVAKLAVDLGIVLKLINIISKYIIILMNSKIFRLLLTKVLET